VTHFDPVEALGAPIPTRDTARNVNRHDGVIRRVDDGREQKSLSGEVYGSDSVVDFHAEFDSVPRFDGTSSNSHLCTTNLMRQTPEKSPTDVTLLTNVQIVLFVVRKLSMRRKRFTAPYTPKSGPRL